MEKVTIGLQGFSDRAENILRLFLSRRFKSTYALVEGRGQLNILDLDNVNAKQLWMEHSQSQNAMPSIVVSVHEQNLPNSIWLRKPLNVERLSEVIDKVITDYQLQQLEIEAQKSPEQAKEHATIMRTLNAVPNGLDDKNQQPAKVSLSEQRLYVSDSLKGFNKAYSSHNLEQAAPESNEARRSLHWYYGSREDEAYTANLNSPELYYDPKEYLQGAYHKALAWAENKNVISQLEGYGIQLIIANAEHTTYSNRNTSFMKQVCFFRATEKVFKFNTLVDASLFERQKKQLQAVNSNRLLWNLSLWSARGRLPVGVSGDTTVSLTHWPNFTRLDIPPHAMLIVALWFNKPTTINNTAEQLNVPFCAVYSVFSACYALGLVKQLSSNELKREQTVKKISLPRQFFRAIFKKLN